MLVLPSGSCPCWHDHNQYDLPGGWSMLSYPSTIYCFYLIKLRTYEIAKSLKLVPSICKNLFVDQFLGWPRYGHQCSEKLRLPSITSMSWTIYVSLKMLFFLNISNLAKNGQPCKLLLNYHGFWRIASLNRKGRLKSADLVNWFSTNPALKRWPIVLVGCIWRWIRPRSVELREPSVSIAMYLAV